MPLFNYRCSSCGLTKSVIRRFKAKKNPPSCSCGTVMTRAPKPPSSRVVETIDNGVMPKRVEKLVDAERLFKERADKHK
jgi:putative FmdB family regulatory protein